MINQQSSNQPASSQIKLTTIKNGSTFLNLNTSKGKVIYRTTTGTTPSNDPAMSTSATPLLVSTLNSTTPQIRTINIGAQQQQQQTVSTSNGAHQAKQIIISNGTATNTSRLSALINNTSTNKTQPSIIVLAPTNVQQQQHQQHQQQQQKQISLKTVIEQPQQVKTLNSLKPLSVIKIQNVQNDQSQVNTANGVQYYISNTATNSQVTTTNAPLISDSSGCSNQLIKSLISIKNEANLDPGGGDDLNSSALHKTQHNEATQYMVENSLAKTKNQKELVKITPIAVQPKSASKIQSILNRPVTFVTQTTNLATSSAAQPTSKVISTSAPPVTATIQTRPPTTTLAQPVQTVQLNSDSKNQTFIKIAAKKDSQLVAQSMQQQPVVKQTVVQSQPQQQQQIRLEPDENLLPNESCLNDLILPDTRIFASLLNKDSNSSMQTQSSANLKDPSNKRVLTDLTYKTVLIGNSEHIILDNMQNLADFRGDFTKLKNLAIAVANRFNKPVTIPAFLLIDSKSALDKVKETLNEKNIHPIIIETTASNSQVVQPPQQQQQQAKSTKQAAQFKEQNHYIIQTLNKPPQMNTAASNTQILDKPKPSVPNKRINNAEPQEQAQPVQKKPRTKKTPKTPNSKFLSSITNGNLSGTESMTNTPVKLDSHVSHINNAANINVSNLSVNQILKLEQQHQQQQHPQETTNVQMLNNFINEQSVANSEISNQTNEFYTNYQTIDSSNLQLEQQPQQQLVTQIELGQNVVYVQDAHAMASAPSAQLDQSNYLVLQQPVVQQITSDQIVSNSATNDSSKSLTTSTTNTPAQFISTNTSEIDFTFDPFDSNVLFNLNEMEFI